ncbi:MAG: hypothetical protein Kow0022_14400 [Phycisphaerales bacterium]
MNRTLSATLLLASAASIALANPVSGQYFDMSTCDSHGTRFAREELGTFIFPPDELIDATSFETLLSACPMEDDPNMPNYLVEMVNLTGRDWTDLFYVANLETRLSNVDGAAWSAAAPGAVGQAFRIDATGLNRNLVWESINSDGVFQAGETWQFIIQDYVNFAGGAAHEFASLDFAGASGLFPGGMFSTGSIVQFVVPSPGSLAMLGLGGAMLGRRRR